MTGEAEIDSVVAAGVAVGVAVVPSGKFGLGGGTGGRALPVESREPGAPDKSISF